MYIAYDDVDHLSPLLFSLLQKHTCMFFNQPPPKKNTRPRFKHPLFSHTTKKIKNTLTQDSGDLRLHMVTKHADADESTIVTLKAPRGIRPFVRDLVRPEVTKITQKVRTKLMGKTQIHRFFWFLCVVFLCLLLWLWSLLWFVVVVVVVVVVVAAVVSETGRHDAF